MSPTPEADAKVSLRRMVRALALELPGPVWQDVDDRVREAIEHIEALEAAASVPPDATEHAQTDRLRHALGSLLAYADDHHVSHAEHDHDCYERWCIERDHARIVIEDTAPAVPSSQEPTK